MAKDPVTLGLCSQRELDAAVAKAGKRAGFEAEDAAEAASDQRDDRDRLIEELRREREQTVRVATEAAQEAEAAAWLEARRTAESQ